MGDMADRLREARKKAGYPTPDAAADSMGVNRATYAQHENGIRGYSRHALRYARKFRTTPEWLLYGRGPQDSGIAEPTLEELERMIADALSEVTLGVRIADLPRIVAPSLHEQLVRFRADREDECFGDQGKDRGKPNVFPPPTRRS